MKTVILVWHNRPTCIDLFSWVKGTCYLFHLSKIIPFRLYVDIQFHVLSNYIECSHPYEQFIRENKQCIETVHDVDWYIKSSDSNLLFFRCTTYLPVKLSAECNAFIRKLFTPKLQLQINRHKVKNVVHVHVNNPIISYPPFQTLFEVVYEKIEPYLTEDTLLLSDTKEFKEYVKVRNKCMIRDTKIGNIGYSPHDDRVEDTLIDFYTMTRANRIYAFSWYNEIPGFLQIVSFYNVEIIML